MQSGQKSNIDPSIETRLESWTYFDTERPDSPHHYVIKLHSYDISGDSEVSYTKVPRRKKFFKRTKDDSSRREMSKEDLHRANSRAKTKVRRKIMAIGADHLLTLTFRENITDPKYAWQCWSKFIRKVRQRYKNYQYVVVAEYQKRGAIHFHAAVKGYQDVRYMRQCWYDVVGEGKGNIDVAYKGEYQPHQIAGYLTKYITKEFEADSKKGLHRYRSVQGIKLTVATLYLPPVAGSVFVTYIKDKFREFAGKDYQSTFFSPVYDNFGWAATW